MVHGSWPFLPTFEELIETADLFVVGEVVAVGPGETSGGVATSNSLIHVSALAKGRLPAGSVVTIYQTGGVEDQTESKQGPFGQPSSLATRGAAWCRAAASGAYPSAADAGGV